MNIKKAIIAIGIVLTAAAATGVLFYAVRPAAPAAIPVESVATDAQKDNEATGAISEARLHMNTGNPTGAIAAFERAKALYKELDRQDLVRQMDDEIISLRNAPAAPEPPTKEAPPAAP